MDNAKVVIVGSINADLVVTVDRHLLPGETLLGQQMAILPGGKGANQAVAAARLGADVTFIGAVGADAHAGPALAGLKDAKVDVSRVESLDLPTGVAVVTVAADGENTIIVIPGANAEVRADVVERHRAVVAGAAVVILQGEIPPDGIARAADLTGGRLIVNLAPAVAVERQVLVKADPLVVNEHEAFSALRILAPDIEKGQDHEAVVSALLDKGVPTVVMTLGAEGAIIGDSFGTEHVSAPIVPVVDTTGAGDAFVGSLGASLAAGHTLRDAVERAVRVGAFAVTSKGAQPSYPSLSDTLPDSGA